VGGNSLNSVTSSVKVYRPILLSKYVIREEGTPWLIKCADEGNINDVGYFDTPPHVRLLITKHVDNNRRKMSIIARNM